MLVLYRAGKTDTEVAEYFKLTARTIWNWKYKYPEFFLALEDTKAEIDGNVKHALYQRAVGYKHVEEKVFCSFGEIITHKTMKVYPPDVGAATLWLKNRQPEKWREVAPLPVPPQLEGATNSNLINFSQFCTNAGYPSPYPKQHEMRAWVIDSSGPNLMLGSRGYGKTDYAVILGIAYDIYCDPEGSRNLIITKSMERNSAILKEIQNALEANGVELEYASSKRLRVAGIVGKDHSVSVTTLKSVSLRGRHPKRIIFDDPVTPEDTGEAARLLLQRVYFEVFKLCKDIRILGQPVHKFDLYADLRGVIPTMEVPYGTIPELDHDLEAQRLAGVSEESIQASYYLKIIDDGNSPFQNVRFLDKYPIGDSVAFIDPSFEGGDYTALSIVRAHFDGIAVVGFTFKKAWNHCLDDLVKRCKAFGVKRICFETNALGDQPVIMLREIFDGGVIGKKSNGNKHSRIMQAGAFAHRIHLSRDSDKQYLEQVVKYEYNCEHDDAPDSLASCMEWIGLIRGKE